MKKKIKIIVAVIIGCFCIQPALGQITYEYDNAGNRVRRSVELKSAEIPSVRSNGLQEVIKSNVMEFNIKL